METCSIQKNVTVLDTNVIVIINCNIFEEIRESIDEIS